MLKSLEQIWPTNHKWNKFQWLIKDVLYIIQPLSQTPKITDHDTSHSSKKLANSIEAQEQFKFFLRDKWESPISIVYIHSRPIKINKSIGNAISRSKEPPFTNHLRRRDHNAVRNWIQPTKCKRKSATNKLREIDPKLLLLRNRSPTHRS